MLRSFSFLSLRDPKRPVPFTWFMWASHYPELSVPLKPSLKPPHCGHTMTPTEAFELGETHGWNVGPCDWTNSTVRNLKTTEEREAYLRGRLKGADDRKYSFNLFASRQYKGDWGR